ncbi:unnamed protein product [Chrysodeixis includens]|uniref:Peptidase S1 domain-containing protein n=1 Tax=Chrysodeixis includens TaxID=689277 RepID=A0A9P0BX66_CHRIL|nr:unnamed protein product [Chrysodeixis includens]
MLEKLLLPWFIAMHLLLVNGNFNKYQYLNLTEGSPCSWDGFDGVCASPYMCLSAMDDIVNKRFPPICSFQGVKAVICCTDCELENILTSGFSKKRGAPGWFYKTGQKVRDSCLDYLDLLGDDCYNSNYFGRHYSRVRLPGKTCAGVRRVTVLPAGGTDATRDQFRHMALLGYGDNIDSAQWICGASLISNKFLLTAGHCIAAPKLGAVRYVGLGILKRSDPLELWQRYLVKRIIPHPQYKPPSKYHDIALLETDTEVSFNKHVFPACLHSLHEPNQAWDDTFEAVGWGALGHNRELADTLQYVELEKFDSAECSQLYPKYRHLLQGYNHTTQMCYGHRTKIRDTCKGDSGGPLQTASFMAPCVFTITGVTSSGRACGFAGNSGLYTRVLHYLPWIESFVWPD